MSEPASISAGIAARYATAVFEIAEESKALDSLETSINDLAKPDQLAADFTG